MNQNPTTSTCSTLRFASKFLTIKQGYCGKKSKLQMP